MKRSSEAALPAIHDPVLVLDREWRVVQANPPAARVYGGTPLELEGRDVWDLLPGGASHPIAPALRRARAEERDVVWEQQDDEAGRRFQYRIYAQPDTLTVLRTESPARAVPPSGTAPAGRFGDEFIAIVSHELRAPLNAILGWAGLLRDGSLDRQMTDHAVDVIERNARAQADLINDLLDLSRLLAGRLPLQRRPVDLPLVVRSAIDAVKTTAAARELSVRADRLPESWMMEGDEDRLRQVLTHLLLYAYKATPSGGDVEVVLEISGSGAELRVTDGGPRLSPEELPQVFARPTRERAAGGRQGGVGLALARHLIEAHGGSVTAVIAADGQGTTLVARLPGQ